jgi:hypothetical protein
MFSPIYLLLSFMGCEALTRGMSATESSSMAVVQQQEQKTAEGSAAAQSQYTEELTPDQTLDQTVQGNNAAAQQQKDSRTENVSVSTPMDPAH